MLEWKTTVMEHFSELVCQHGGAFEALDWHRGGQASQARHFAKLLEIDAIEVLTGSSVLDVGCGFGDLKTFMEERVKYFDYMGVDLVPGMIAQARKRHPTAKFGAVDIMGFTSAAFRSFDYVLASGVVVWIPEGQWGIFELFIQRMFDLCKRGVAFNMYSTQVPEVIPGRFYADPWDVMKLCKQFACRVKIDYGYMPETFMVYLYREDC